MDIGFVLGSGITLALLNAFGKTFFLFSMHKLGTEKERDRQTDRQTDTDRHRQTHRETHRHTQTDTDRQTETDRGGVGVGGGANRGKNTSG